MEDKSIRAWKTFRRAEKY